MQLVRHGGVEAGRVGCGYFVRRNEEARRGRKEGRDALELIGQGFEQSKAEEGVEPEEPVL